MTDYQVIIVGGRPAGSTLAARLGEVGLRVLLLERAPMPSPPGASCPIIYSPTMRMLDEIGADEHAYARATPKIRRMVTDSDGMEGSIPIPMGYGRDYAYALDRSRFDYALFENALRFPTVEGRIGTAVVDVIQEQAAVTGVIVKNADGTQERLSADLVIGADGRFSTVARKVGATERDERDKYPASIYYAYWKDAPPYDDHGPAAVAGGPGYGYGYLMMDSADDTVVVAFEGQSALIDPDGGKVEAFYRHLIAQNPSVARRLRDATMVTKVHGMKQIGNLYRQAGGTGWALVGDAYHQKDPIDGQGIYDALTTAKLLADEIGAYFRGEKLWAEAVISYDQQARRATFAMYESTIERSRSSLYAQSPAWVKPLFRWVISDPLAQEKLGMMLTRQISPNQVMSVPLILGILMRGPLRDLSHLLEKAAR